MSLMPPFPAPNPALTDLPPGTPVWYLRGKPPYVYWYMYTSGNVFPAKFVKVGPMRATIEVLTTLGTWKRVSCLPKNVSPVYPNKLEYWHQLVKENSK